LDVLFCSISGKLRCNNPGLAKVLRFLADLLSLWVTTQQKIVSIIGLIDE